MIKINKIDINYNDIPLSEYPRPLLKRASYLCLNGDWEYEITNKKKIDFVFTKHIMVPYAVETPLSGVNHLLRPDEILVYNKKVTLPDGFLKKHLILHFDGVDQICEVYVDNKKVGRHEGGYTKFSYDIASFVTSNEFYVSVVCIDKTDTSYYSRGKQALRRGGIFYTSTSGIYKPVWLEALDEEYIKDIKYLSLYDDKCLRMYIDSTRSAVCKVLIDDQEIVMNTNQEALIKLKSFRPWSIDDPYLYKVKIKYFDDEVTSYFAMRKIELKCASDGFTRFYLNNKLTFIKGVLDQGYYYLGSLTPKTYTDYENDILDVKKLGFNMIRKHIKTEIDLFYYYCDKEGMLVFQDFINGGEKYTKKASFIPGLFPKYHGKNDAKKYKVYGRENAEGQVQWIKESFDIQKELFNHPSVVAYTIFNEGWGQYDSKINYTRFKNNDPTRFYDTNSGWVDFGKSDFNSVHNYFYKNKIHKDRFDLNRPQFLSEYGGYGLYLPDNFYGSKPFGYRNYKTKEILTEKYLMLHTKYIIPMVKKGLMGTVYTQLSDVEDEINGLYTFDRKVLKIDSKTILNINNLIDEELKDIK